MRKGFRKACPISLFDGSTFDMKESIHGKEKETALHKAGRKREAEYAVLNASRALISGGNTIAELCGTAVAPVIATVGAPVVGASALVTNMALAHVSARKTMNHIHNLQKILLYSHNNFYKCDGDKNDHAQLHDVLIFILNKKRSKLTKKQFSRTGVAAPMVSVYTAFRGVSKRIDGTIGEQRCKNSYDLAKHLVTCNCKLADAIVGELLGHDNLNLVKRSDSHEAAGMIFGKMNSK